MVLADGDLVAKNCHVVIGQVVVLDLFSVELRKDFRLVLAWYDERWIGADQAESPASWGLRLFSGLGDYGVAPLVLRVCVGRDFVEDFRDLLVGVVVDDAQEAVVQVAVDLWEQETWLGGIKNVPNLYLEIIKCSEFKYIQMM